MPTKPAEPAVNSRGTTTTMGCNDNSGLVQSHEQPNTCVQNFHLQCGSCGKQFSDRKALLDHRKSYKQEKTHECYFCEKKFYFRRDRENHELVHTKVKKHECPDCGQLFLLKSHLKSHSFVHSGVKPYECDQCGRKFTHRQNFRAHQNVHKKKEILRNAGYVIAPWGRPLRPLSVA